MSPPLPAPDDPQDEDLLPAELAEPALPVAEEVSSDSVELPVAEVLAEPPAVVAPPVPLPRSRPVVATPRRQSPEPEPSPARPRNFAACGVIGCFGVMLLGAVGFLAYAAVLIIETVGTRIADRDRTAATNHSARPGPVARTALAGNTGVVELPDECDAVCRGAGGRFLILRIPKRSELVVFDPNAAITIHTIKLESKASRFAASASKLFVWDSAAEQIHRYDLVTFERELTVEFRRGGVHQALVAGFAVDDQLVAISTADNRGQAITLDPETLQIKSTTPLPQWNFPTAATSHVRVSADGLLVGRTTQRSEGDSAFVYRREGENYSATQMKPASEPFGHLAPSADRRYLYTSRGAFNATGQPIEDGDADVYALPTAHGDGLFLGLTGDRNAGFARSVKGPLSLHLAGDHTPLTPPLTSDIPTGLPIWDGTEFPVDQRIHLWPAAGLLAVIPTPPNRLLLTKVDVGERLKSSGQRHLVFGSDPPRWAVRGTEWRYRPEIWAGPNLNPKVSLASPIPPGMRIDAGTDIAWDEVPKDLGPYVDVQVAATDPNRGVRTVQKFRVAILDPPAADDDD